MDVRGGFMTIDECDNVGMVEALEDIDLRGKVILELLVELRQIDGLDGDKSPGFLERRETPISINPDMNHPSSQIHYSPCARPDKL